MYFSPDPGLQMKLYVQFNIRTIIPKYNIYASAVWEHKSLDIGRTKETKSKYTKSANSACNMDCHVY